ncbi:MAG: amino acid adenylation domain-containing protein [Actinomycetota bacterium]
MRFLVNHLLEASAREHPRNAAVVDGERTLAFAELDDRANRLARLLVDLGVEKGDRVGLYLDKSLESVVGIYGVLKAGACYVPFDPQAPVARLAYIAGNCGVRVLLTDGGKADHWAGLVEGGSPVETLVVLDAAEPPPGPPGARVLGAGALDHQPAAPPEGVGAVDEDLAYILYTSGSTGTPKGVMLTHRNALAFVLWAADLLAIGPQDRLSSHAPLHFDLSVFDLFAAAAAGASVSLVPPRAAMFPADLARFIEERQITVWYSVPSALTMLVTRGGLRGGELPSLRAVVFAGEVFPTKYLRRLMELLPHAAFYNWYGPTETNVCTWYRVPELPPDRAEPIPIGRAIANDEVAVVTEEGTRAAPGEVGELHVRGATVMKGYWGDPERTAATLVPTPWGGPPGVAYRTGDLVVEEGDGNLRFLGRKDAQIKSRGYRIELGEIETTLYAHPSVVECSVAAIPDELVTNRIKAFVVVRGDVDHAELAGFCAGRLPRYMIPEVFEFRDVLPKTSTGKIDRQALAGA